MNKYLALLATCLITTSTQAAQLIDLKDNQTQVLREFSKSRTRNISPFEVKEISRYTDFNHIQHVRMQQYYRGYPIWNAHAVLHLADAKGKKRSLDNLLEQTQEIDSMNGELYQQLDTDLNKASAAVFSQARALESLQVAQDAFKTQQKIRDVKMENPQHELQVFVDENQVAHWVYKISFDIPKGVIEKIPMQPTYIIDAQNFKIYKSWNNVNTARTIVVGGGYGGNPRIGKIIYDGLSGNYPSFQFSRDENGECYFQNNVVNVYQTDKKETMHFPCKEKDAAHNNLYWSGDFDTVNQGYSPANDAMFIANVVRKFYKEWCGVPVLKNRNGKEMLMQMEVHLPEFDGAYWQDNTMHFGDGLLVYPLTSIGVGAHEMSHGFTQQHSNLIYEGQSGGMNEAFSDMAAQAAEYYVYNQCSWKIGAEIFKLDDEALRFMDQPSKDCYGKLPGTHCSIDHASQYFDGLDVHHSSGVYNRAFYLLSTQKDWNTRKAFEVMAHANASYWTPTTQFNTGAACVVKAAQDLKYDVNAVKQAFKTVGVNADGRCTN